ncbi:helicase [Robbsia andropogonis]|uniref:DNA 3'-5' helicase II n=1 Tax=Robbsia andropogonis TaxID=28092 RepID=A0A0F5K2L6_9BURK|nr:ATP-binding domain-containing protein [Robbsia andropogonis]KKB63792.1 helicase [Robbsia andropogonis]
MPPTVSVVIGTNDKPVASLDLANYFSHPQGIDGQLMIGYPIIGTPDGRHAIDAILVTPQKGIVAIDLIEGGDPGDYDARQDDAANRLEARLKTYRDLMRRRDMLIPIHTISYAPGVHDVGRFAIPGYSLVNRESLQAELDRLEWPTADQRVYEIAVSAIQSISSIRASRTKRVIVRDDSRGARLKRLEDSIATLDNRQGKAVLETVEGVQRIRGLAGSGKTIVLALKAAYLHAQHPDWRIAVTFNTRSLKGQFRRLINNFCIEQGEEPNWGQLRILNAWGAPGGDERDGIYHDFCRSHSIDYYDFSSAKNTFGMEKVFAGACEHALAQVRDRKPLYDVILIDEAQDFPSSFLRLCYEALGDEKRLVYAYDELQSLSSESLPPPEEIFGRTADGSPRVRFENGNDTSSRRDIILNKCYRNSRPVLVTAHALGFGIYRTPAKDGDTGLVQMFDQPHLWEEIGYRRRDGDLHDGAHVTLSRTEESSPAFLENHSPPDDLVQFIKVDNVGEQAEWLAQAIKNNLEQDELRHDDIVVINPDPTSTRREVGPIRRRLLDMGIQTHTAGVDTDPDIFFQSDNDSITFTGIFRAKGNEAGMVYIINAQDCNSSAWNLSTIRNRLFTAITRSKAWVRVLGYGPGMQQLIDEFERVKQHNFELSFVYPTKDQREKLKIVHRDVTPADQKRFEARQRALADALNDMDQGRLHFDDLDPAVQAQLQNLWARKQ